MPHGICTFYFDTVLKTTKPSNHQHPLVFNTYPKLCIVDCLQEYRCRTDLVRENIDGNPQELIWSYVHPFKLINVQSIARCIKHFFAIAEVDIAIFTTYSVLSASTSKANNIVSIKAIQKAAHWKSSNTFRQHYKFPLKILFRDELFNAFIK